MSTINKKIINIIVYAFLIIWALIVLFPFYWMILTSIKSYASYNAEYVPKLYATNPTWANYVSAFTEVSLFKYLINTTIFAVVTTLIMLVVIVAWIDKNGKTCYN